MEKTVFLGIDIGTSGVKAVIATASGQIVESATTPLSVSRPKPLWSEQDPMDWWQATAAAVKQFSTEARAGVQAISLSGQMHGATLLDRDHKPLRPAILWNDGRSFAECERLQETCPDFLTKGGNLVMPGFTAPKLEWVRQHEPDVFAQIDKVLLPKDYVRLRMTGEFASDMSDSAGTLWMDVAQRDWHDPLLAACGLSRAHMPDLYEGTSQTGTLRAAIAADWGMARVPVFAGGGDNAAGAVAVGVANAGQTLLSLGTSGVIFTVSETYRSNPQSAVHAFCHAVPDRWHLMSVMLSAASCLDWACRITQSASVDAMIHAAEVDGRDDSEIYFAPYLSGERTPHNDPTLQGALFGLTHSAGVGDIARAVLEGVAFGLADGFAALLAAGAQMDQLSVVGGGARSRFWGKIIASALERPLIYHDGADVGPALGAARLAALGTGALDLKAGLSTPPVLYEIEPDPDWVSLFRRKRAVFKQLYTRTRPINPGEPNG